MEEAWKACFHQSSPRTVGLITVLALSGSVVLMSIGKQTLVLFKSYVLQSMERRNANAKKRMSSKGFFRSPSRRSEFGHDIFKLRAEKQSCTNVCSSVVYSSESSCSASVEASSPDAADKKRRVTKKVRFSADVIEPSGNNQEYRRRIMSGWRKDVNQQPSSYVPDRVETASDQSMRRMHRMRNPDIPANRMALYNSLQQQQRLRRALYHR